MMGKKKKKVLSKFTILWWAAFIATLGLMLPVGHGGWTPLRFHNINKAPKKCFLLVWKDRSQISQYDQII